MESAKVGRALPSLLLIEQTVPISLVRRKQREDFRR